MKTISAIVLVAFVASLAMAGGYGPSLLNESGLDRVQGSGFSASNKYTNDLTPRIAIRIDDGKDVLVNDGSGRGNYWGLLKNGVPTSLALNYNLLGTAGYATVADIQRIISEYDSAGVPIEIVTHFDTNLVGASAYTWNQLLDECNPSELEAALGVDVRSAAQVGGTAQIAFTRRQFGAMRKALIEGGIEYFDSSYIGSSGSLDSIPHTGWSFQAAGALTDPEILTSFSDRALYPGVSSDPYAMPVVHTIDLGNTWIERAAGANYDAWNIRTDGSGTPTTDWRKTLVFLYGVHIANQWGGVWAIHDTTLTVTYAGEFSIHRLGEVVKALEDEGYIDLVTVSEAYDWAMKKVAPGTDFVPDKWDFPNFDIGDSVGVEVAWLPGWGANSAGGATWTGTQSSGNWTAGSFAKYDRTANFPTDLVSSSVSGYRSKLGGFTHETTGNANRQFFIRGNLPPGRYEFSMSLTGTSRLTQLRDFQIVMVGKSSKMGGVFTSSRVWADTLVTLRRETTDLSITHNANPQYVTYQFSIDPRAADRIVQWGDETDATYGDRFSTGTWEGGLFVYVAGSDGDVYSDVELRYLGPID